MPKAPILPPPSSAIQSDLLAAASPLQRPAPVTHQANCPTVRREFAITPELDEFLGYTVVPKLRNLTGWPVTRSAVARALLSVLANGWDQVCEPDLGQIAHAVGSRSQSDVLQDLVAAIVLTPAQ